MHLLEKYSLSCGISPSKLGKPYIYTSYYPLPSNKYIVIHPSSGMASKNYSYYQDVVDFIHEQTKKAGFEIIQIGEEKDAPLSKCINLQGKTNIHQTCFVLKNASFFIGNDSFSTHVSSAFGTPLVSLYSTIQPEVAGPYWNNGKQFTIMAPLEGKKPKYAVEDPDRCIDRIKPEEILEKMSLAIPEIDLSRNNNLESLFFGKNYPRLSTEFVPDNLIELNNGTGIPLNIRFDYLDSDISDHNINSALMNLLKRKCGIITSRPFDLAKFKDNRIKENIISFVFHIEKNSLDSIGKSIEFINYAKKLGFNIKVALIKENFSEEEVSELKFKFLNIQGISFLNQTSWETCITEDINKKINNLTIFKSSRIIYSNNKVFLSRAALSENKPTNKFTQPLSDIQDLKALGKELENCYLYNI
jgi:hypothetical protein